MSESELPCLNCGMVHDLIGKCIKQDPVKIPILYEHEKPAEQRVEVLKGLEKLTDAVNYLTGHMEELNMVMASTQSFNKYRKMRRAYLILRTVNYGILLVIILELFK